MIVDWTHLQILKVWWLTFAAAVETGIQHYIGKIAIRHVKLKRLVQGEGAYSQKIERWTLVQGSLLEVSFFMNKFTGGVLVASIFAWI